MIIIDYIESIYGLKSVCPISVKSRRLSRNNAPRDRYTHAHKQCEKCLLRQYIKVHVHGQNLSTVYDQLDMSMLPEEYLPDDYTGPNAGTVQDIASK